jgi:hypothetical protein
MKNEFPKNTSASRRSHRMDCQKPFGETVKVRHVGEAQTLLVLVALALAVTTILLGRSDNEQIGSHPVGSITETELKSLREGQQVWEIEDVWLLRPCDSYQRLFLRDFPHFGSTIPQRNMRAKLLQHHPTNRTRIVKEQSNNFMLAKLAQPTTSDQILLPIAGRTIPSKMCPNVVSLHRRRTSVVRYARLADQSGPGRSFQTNAARALIEEMRPEYI